MSLLRRPEAAAALAAVVALGTGWLLGDRSWVGRALVVRDEPGIVDAVFVLSGDVDFHRTRHAVRVFRKTEARWFVVSGAGFGGDSGELMAEAALQAGIPREALVVEVVATTTRENVALVAPLLESLGVRRVAVVTSPFHSRRAAMAARKAWKGVEVVSVPVPDDDPHSCAPDDWGTRCQRMGIEEWRRLLWYAIRGWI